MAETKAKTERTKTRQEAREAADRIAAKFPPESAMPIPIADGVRFGADAMKHWLETGQDMARFYNSRLSKDFAYMTKLGTCRSPAQAAELWWRAASEAAHDYADQFDRVMAINLNGAATADEDR